MKSQSYVSVHISLMYEVHTCITYYTCIHLLISDTFRSEQQFNGKTLFLSVFICINSLTFKFNYSFIHFFEHFF